MNLQDLRVHDPDWNVRVKALKDVKNLGRRINKYLASALQVSKDMMQDSDERVRVVAGRTHLKLLVEDVFHCTNYKFFDDAFDTNAQRTLIGRFKNENALKMHERWLGEREELLIQKFDGSKHSQEAWIYFVLVERIRISLGLKKEETLWLSLIPNLIYRVVNEFDRPFPQDPLRFFHTSLKWASSLLKSFGHPIDSQQDHSVKITALAKYLKKSNKGVLFFVIPVVFLTKGRALSESEKKAVKDGIDSLDERGQNLQEAFNTVVKYGNSEFLDVLHFLIQYGASPSPFTYELPFTLKNKVLVFDPNGWDRGLHQISEDGSPVFGSFTGRLAKPYPRIAHWIYHLSDSMHTEVKPFAVEVKRRFCEVKEKGIVASLDVVVTSENEVYGRSVRLKDGTTLKFTKKNESLDAFHLEAVVNACLQELPESQKPWSKLPHSHKICSLDEVPDQIKKEIKVGIETQNTFVLCSLSSLNYFNYLNSPTINPDEFIEGMQAFLRDGAWMVSQGMFPQSTAMFHNEQAGRRYLTLVGWVNSRRWGAGRLHDLEGAVRYPNAGFDGIRDVGDFYFEDDIIERPRTLSSDLTFYEYEEVNAKRFLLRGNALAELALNQFLLIQSRLLECSRLQSDDPQFIKLDWTDAGLIKMVASWGIEGMAAIRVGYAGWTRDALDNARRHASDCGVNWKRWAEQLVFWIQTDEKGYVGHLDKNKCPPFEELYGFTPTGVGRSDWTAVENWRPGRGLMSDNQNLDLGGFNRSFPCTEEEKRWHILLEILVTKEKMFRDGGKL